MDSEKRRKIVQYDQLTPLGQAVWLAGAAVHLGTRVVESSVRRVGRVAIDTRQAFLEGLNRTPKNGASDSRGKEHIPPAG
jgi:hypothetical protein